MMGRPRKPISGIAVKTWVPAPLHAELQQVAAQRDLSISAVMRVAIRKLLIDLRAAGRLGKISHRE